MQTFWQDTPCGQPANITVNVLGSAQALSRVCINAGWQVEVNLPEFAVGEYSVVVNMSGAPQNLNSLVLSGPSNVPIYLHLSGVLNAGSITRTDGGALYVTGTIVGNLGSLTASHLFVPQNDGILVRGDVLGPISLLDVSTPDTARGELRVQSLTPGVGGNLLGNVTVLAGALAGINASGKIGAPGSPVTIRSTLDIGSIKATEIHANITAGWNGPASKIYRVAAVGGGGVSGDLTGSVTAATIGQAPLFTGLEVDPPGIEVKGDLGTISRAAELTFTQGLESVEGNPRLVRADGGFAPGSRISLPANGLGAQVLFNLADGSANWLQAAEVVVGTRTLTTPLYTDTPAQLGGGSVGVARFDLYATACEPMNGQTVAGVVPPNIIIEDPTCQQLEQHAVSILETVFVRHYGPVTYSTGERDPGFIPPFMIRQAPLGTNDWTDVTSEYYAETPSPASLSNSVALKRTLGRKWPLGMKFEITPTTDLRCVSVDGSPIVAPYTYHFSNRFKCEDALVDLFDLDGSSSLGLADMLTWLTNPEDVTRDGATSGQDLSTLAEGVAEYQSLPQN